MSDKYSASKITDVLIVGSGVAGAYAALQFGGDVSVLMLSKYALDESNSYMAQGGIAAVSDFDADSYERHINDTLIAGQYANDPEAVDILVREGTRDVESIINLGVDFDKKADGGYDRTLEGGHTARRIFHYKDSTGREMTSKLLAAVRQKNNVAISENTTLLSLTKVRSGFRADILKDGNYMSVFCGFCVLCTGGIGRIYKYTTNPRTATGDGIRIAMEAGARVKDLSLIQFHPTAFNPGGTDKEKFLISESVRGEGAYLLNNNYERFMHRYDERLELAPRDVVSKSIMIESRRTGANDFYLDIRHKGEAFLKSRFPGIYAGCLRGGVDMTKDLIPVFPCQHYLMGGIEVGMDSKTGVERLYAAGECACTGVHGKNRLASNSLLEGIVFGRRAAEDIKRCMAAGYPKASVFPCDNDYSGAPPPPNIKEEIRELMQRSYFVIPDEGAVRTGLRQAENILKRLKDGKYAVTTDYTEALTMAAMAVQILRDLGAGD